jgi:hypothetical protein
MTPQTALLHTGTAWRNKLIHLSGVERLTDSKPKRTFKFGFYTIIIITY